MNAQIMVAKFKPNEVVIKAGDSVHELSNARVKGKLILTNQRLYFKQSDSASDDYLLEVLPADIKEVICFKSGWFSNNGLEIHTADGRKLSFILKNRSNWGEIIASMC